MVVIGLITKAQTRELIFFSAVNVSKMDKTDNTILTNLPETGAIPPLVSSRVVECLGVVEKAVFDAIQPNRRYSSSAVSVMAEQKSAERRQRWNQRRNGCWRWVMAELWLQGEGQTPSS